MLFSSYLVFINLCGRSPGSSAHYIHQAVAVCFFGARLGCVQRVYLSLFIESSYLLFDKRGEAGPKQCRPAL